MEEKKLIQIKFGSFMKLYTSIFLSLGIGFGILAFIISLFGGHVTANIGSLQLKGITAGLVSIILFPIIFSTVGAVFGLFSFLPFKFFLKTVKGIKIKMNLE
jgi:hypothetical protein